MYHQMNNEQKNTYVKQQLTRALLELLQKKTLAEISVSELTERAGVGRVSFYRNFHTKEDNFEGRVGQAHRAMGKAV